ncbi:MAG TPA: amidohydrolase family protein, partial [Pseudomonadales bacterium]|nr:amidohydrolase family protein [Pseudomonadales bacterium]
RGAKGVKSQLTDCGILADDRRLWPLYDYLQARQIPLQMVTAEWAPGLNRPSHCAAALAEFPQLRLIFSHIGHGHRFGEGSDAEFVELARKYSNVCGDLSLRLPEVVDGHIDPHAMVAHIRKIGTDRIFYGSNFSLNEMLHPGPPPGDGEFQLSETLKGLRALATLPLSDDERVGIAGRNYRQWMKLDTRTTPPPAE